MDELNLFIPLKKVDAAQRLVFGVLAAEVADHSGEIMDYETAKPAFKAWSDEIAKTTEGKSLGNVRAMHTSIAAGKLVDIAFDDVAKTITGCAKIIDDGEWKKVEEGVYTGFSMGGKYVKRWTCPANAALKRYTPAVAEVSIVDNPCIPVAKFEFVKADGTSEMRKFKLVKDADADLKQVWQANDGSIFEKKADALQKNIDLAATAAVAPINEVLAAMDALKKANEAMAAKEGTEQATEPLEKAASDETSTATETTGTTDATVVEKSADEKAEAYKALVHRMALAKQLCDIPMVCNVVDSLAWLQGAIEYDALFAEAKTTNLPENLKAILADLCQFLRDLVADATADIVEDAAKAITFEQAETLRKFIGKTDLLPGITAPASAELPADLEKVRTEHAAELQKVSDDLAASKAREETLTKTVTDLTSGIGDLTKRIEHLEAQPAPAKGVKHATTTVHKGHEGQASGAEQAPDEATLALKFAHLPPEQARKRIAEEMAKGQ